MQALQDLAVDLLTGPSFLAELARLALLAATATAAYFVTRVWLAGSIRRLTRRSRSTWDDVLIDAGVFQRVAYVAPALVARSGIGLATERELLVQMVERGALAVMVLVGALALGATMSALNEIWMRDPENRHRPVKGYLQVVKIAMYVLAGLSILSILLERSPWIFVSGIGALSAVLLLIFRDTILSFVASVQITNNDMVHVGDWIEMPKYGADGDVIDVALHTVKIQNWDKTITTVPTHALIADSFKNWRGMSASGGRRIKRALYFDVNSVRFLEPDEIERFSKWALLRDYIAGKRDEIDKWNAESGRDPAIRADVRSLTNIGTLRAYVFHYLKAHPKIHQDMTLLVRQLPLGPEGLPIELYCFTNDTSWNAYEGIQADIFDHVIAIVPEFGLRLFQSPSGADFERVGAAASGGES